MNQRAFSLTKTKAFSPFHRTTAVIPQHRSDSGCTRFDAVPIVEEVFSEWELAPNGVYPLVRFATDRSPSEAMARLQTTANGTRILVPNFRWLFQPDMEAKYGMMFRFQLNEQGNELGNRTFARR